MIALHAGSWDRVRDVFQKCAAGSAKEPSPAEQGEAHWASRVAVRSHPRAVMYSVLELVCARADSPSLHLFLSPARRSLSRSHGLLIACLSLHASNCPQRTSAAQQ